MDYSLPSSSVHGIFQAIVLEWIAISFFRGSSWPRDRSCVSHIVDRRFTIWAIRKVQFSTRTQFSSVAQSCLTLCSTPGILVHHQPLELAQTHVHRVGNAIQPSHPLSFPSPPASIFPSITGFSSESVLHIRWPKDWNFSISPSNEYSGLISFRVDWFDLLAV